MPEGSLIDDLTTTLLVPTVGMLTLRDLPTLDVALVEADFALTVLRFFVEVVVAK